MATNKAVQLANYHTGSPTLEVVELPIPTAGAGEVLVKITLRPVNPADGFVFATVYPGFTPAKENANPVAGLEGTGVVEAIGDGVTKFSVGQRVVGAPFPSVQSGNGTWQQYLVAPEDSLVAVPDSVPDESAAQVCLIYCTQPQFSLFPLLSYFFSLFPILVLRQSSNCLRHVERPRHPCW
jgi:NADPH2:quinone reductase